MLMIGKIILIFIAAALFVLTGVAGYVFILMIRRFPITLYEARARQPDFIPLVQIPKRQVELLLALEDRFFYTHHGYDIDSIRNAIEMNSRSRKIIWGGSTITQQLAKNLYFRFTHNYLRKAAELLIALVLERRLGKDRILELYVNIIYFGNGVYGISDAARFYFDKPVSRLSLNQMLMLACIPAVPTRGNPIQHPEVFERIRNKRLNFLTAMERPVITPAEAEEIRARDSDCLDPDLKKPDETTRNFPQTIPLINERFGPLSGVTMKNGRRRKQMLIIGIIIAVLLVLAIVAGFLIAGRTVAIKPCTPEEARAWEEQYCDLSWYDTLEKTDYTVTSYDGYVLHAQFLKNPEDTNRYVIISHGNTGNRFGAMKYASVFLEQGFNVIVYDLRGHGLDEPTFCTYTVRERKDLLAMIRDSRERYPRASLFGIHGESLGASASVAVLEEKPPVDFVVADCGFSEILPVLYIKAAEMHLPGFLFDLASVFAGIRFGCSFSQMRPIDSLKENTIPILFIHGADDHSIPPEHSERMKAATKGYAELHLIPGAAHAMSVITDPKAYREYVADFLAGQFPGR